MSQPTLGIVRLPHAQGLDLPAYQTTGSAGMDLSSATPPNETTTLLPGQRALLPTGLKFEIPHGFEVQIRPRSGLALKHGITCLNTPGTIDSDYRGEIQVLLINLGTQEFHIERGMRIAQAIVAPVTQMAIQEKSELSQTKRGTEGFGSTGH